MVGAGAENEDSYHGGGHEVGLCSVVLSLLLLLLVVYSFLLHDAVISS